MSLQQRIIDSLWNRKDRHKVYDIVRNMYDDNLESFLSSQPPHEYFVIRAVIEEKFDSDLESYTSKVFLCAKEDDLETKMEEARTWTFNEINFNIDMDDIVAPPYIDKLEDYDDTANVYEKDSQQLYLWSGYGSEDNDYLYYIGILYVTIMYVPRVYDGESLDKIRRMSNQELDDYFNPIPHIATEVDSDISRFGQLIELKTILYDETLPNIRDNIHMGDYIHQNISQ